MLVGLVRFFRGYVKFSANGKFPERFLNITSRYGISLWNANPMHGGLEAEMYVCDYRKIRNVARKTGIRLRILQKHGLPFFVNKYKSRIGIPVGAVVGTILIFALSNFIWSVSITGTSNLSRTYIEDVLARNGVSVGAFKNNIDAKAVERNTMLEVNKVGWMGVNITGSIISVEVKEKAEKPELRTDDSPSNLKALCDGVITKINVRSGVTKVMKGSGVAKGDLLVSGVLQNKEEDMYQYTKYVRSEGEVFADVSMNKELSLPKNYNYCFLSDNKTERRRLKFLWFDIPADMSFNRYDDFVCSYEDSLFCLNDTALPMGIKKRTDYELCEKENVIDKGTAEKIFENEAVLYESFGQKESSLVSRRLNISEKNGCYFCNIDYIYNENIAQNVDFSVTEQQ